MDFPDLSALPPWAIAAFVIALAVIVAVDRFGVRKGAVSSTAPAGSASVAAVIVDPSALNRASAALEANNVAQGEANMIARLQVAATERLAKVIEGLGGDVDKLTDEVIRSAAKMK